MDFTEIITDWYSVNKRDLPWRHTKDPYKIWLSEIILQQTRVDQGLPYYLTFVKHYPDVKTLADASEDRILKDWQGLGYYSRARNLHATAKEVVEKYNSEFPNSYKELISLKGVGSYTAAAIASLAFNLPYAVVDGNVYRVLSRFLGINEPIDSSKGKKIFESAAREKLDKDDPGTYNQAIMEFGARQCMPVKPNCDACPLIQSCHAYNTNRISLLPVKQGKIKQRKRFFNYLVINENETIYIEKRTSNDIWKNLYQFPLIESDKLLSEDELYSTTEWIDIFGKKPVKIVKRSKEFKHTLSHQKISAQFFEIDFKHDNQYRPKLQLKSVLKENIIEYAVPKLIDKYLVQKFENTI
ncbi:A/G-specific adenine glycosylase [bacterium AH-315-C07]|nr:A/G-specific adenine glycosylase [bacterium AH-315-C07]